MSMKILITGAGGFIGGFIVEEALSRGYETWAGVRKTTSREHLSDPQSALSTSITVTKKFLPTNYYRIKGNTEHGTTSFIIWGLQNAKIPMTSIESTTAL